MLIVEVEEGKLRGVEKESILTGDSYYAFLGIPYAQPPVGELRFRAPVPSEKWDGVRDASEKGDQCMHTSCWSEDLGVVRIQGSENCLYLNVFLPQTPSDIEDKKAVVVYIRGGEPQNNESGSTNGYSPQFFLSHDVICVTLNYRLHVFGFLNAGTESCPGNAGLKDQLLALKWIKKNIANFGGDSQNITILGEGTGAASVYLHMASPLSKDLFQRVILQRGSCFVPLAYDEDNECRARYIGRLAGYHGQDLEELVQHLKTQSAERLCKVAYLCNKKTEHMTEWYYPGQSDSIIIRPTVEKIKDGAFLPDRPDKLIDDAPRIPTLIGYSNQEGVLSPLGRGSKLLNEIIADPCLFIKQNFDLNEDEQNDILTRINELYFDNGTWTREGVIKLYTELYNVKFYDAMDCLIESNYSPQTYEYCYDGTFTSLIITAKNILHFEITGPAGLDKLGYVFSSKKGNDGEATEADKGVIENFSTIWIDFIKHGDPTYSLPQTDRKPKTDSHHCYLSIKKKLITCPAKLKRHIFWKDWSSKFVY